MSELSKNELRRLDLTLLLIFLGILKHRKASVVASELGLTQSAISQALRRLRDVFEDELFIRRPHGLEPTARALSLEGPIAGAVELLSDALGEPKSFEPENAIGIVRVAATDIQQAIFIPPLLKRLQDAAPGLRLSVLPLGRREAIDALIERSVDIALGFFWSLPNTISSQLLYEESYLVAGRPELLREAPFVSLDDYCAYKHVLMSPVGDLSGIVDEALARLGRQRNTVLAVPGFMTALASAAGANALITLPARIAQTHAPGFGLVLAAPPLELRSFPVSATWHRRNDTDPRRRWLLEALESCLLDQVG